MKTKDKTCISESVISWCGSFLPLRHRYMLTKNNRVRLRYTLPSGIMSAFVALAVLTSFSQNSQALYHADAAISSQEQELAESLAIIHEHAAKTQENALNDDKRYIEELDRAPLNPIAFLKAKQEIRRIKKDNIDTQDKNSVLPIIPPRAEQRPQLETKTTQIGEGDTLAGVLNKNGVPLGEAYQAIKSMSDKVDPKQIKPGQKVTLSYSPSAAEGEKPRMHSFTMQVTPFENVKVMRVSDNEFQTSMVKADVRRKVYAHNTEIELSLFGSGLKAGIPASVIADAIYIYSWDVDFQRDIRKGDILEVMYEQFETPEGQNIKTGDIMFARLDVNGQDIQVYRYKKKNGDVDYYTSDGVSLRKALMKTPVDGARISSGYGKRTHPVLGYTKMHKGVDFAAPRGTPIYAAGDGTIEKAGMWSSYGNYIRIRHNSELKTAYAHLQKFAKGITPGKRVKQGQVIGYIGTTGRSTGPHLHYEVLKNGTQVHPHKIDLPQGETLKGTELANFKAHMDELRNQYASISNKPIRFAAAN